MIDPAKHRAKKAISNVRKSMQVQRLLVEKKKAINENENLDIATRGIKTMEDMKELKFLIDSIIATRFNTNIMRIALNF